MMEGIIRELLDMEEEIRQEMDKVAQEVEKQKKKMLDDLEQEKRKILEQAESEKKRRLDEARKISEDIRKAVEEQGINDIDRYQKIYRENHRQLVDNYFQMLTKRG